MASTVKIEIRRTVMTPRGRKFPPRKVEIIDLISSSDTDGDVRKDEFHILRENVASRFPRLQERFMILSKDEAGELIPCNNQVDLLKVIQQTTATPLQLYVQELANWQNENRSKGKELRCSYCESAIEGKRVKCLECEDFNLCRHCDERNVHDHHVMVRTDRQRFFNWALPMFKEILPKLCREMREKNPANHFARLEPKEIWQFWQKEKTQNDDKIPKEQSTFGKRKHFMRRKQCCLNNSCNDYQEEIYCTNCNGMIKGMRVKCLECDVNLCGQCDDMGIHGDHVMVRSERPRFFNHGLQTAREILPNLCEEKRRNINGEFIPRLTQKDVIEYWRQTRSECRAEANNVFKRKRQRMRERWCRFLDEIPTYQPIMSEDEEMSSDTSNMVSEVSSATKLTGETTEQMRRQWMQNCHKQWRQQMSRNEDLDENRSNYRQRMWKPYMRKCWNMWQEETKEDESGNRRRSGKETGARCHHPRRMWMKNCWKMWCEEADQNKSRWMADDSTRSVENVEQTGRCSNDIAQQRPFPGFHFLMMKSWKMMQEQSSTFDNVNPNRSPDKVCETTKSPNREFGMRPSVAKHMLKQCWVNGCRELWWMEVRKQLNVEEHEEKKEVNGENSEKMMELSEEDMLKVMIAKPHWRSYMQHCWRLWKQVNKRAGFLESTEPGNSSHLEKKSLDVVEHPKGKWIKACWPIWLEEMTRRCDVESEKCRKRDAVKLNRRPFVGWHPLIIRSWQMMQTYLNESQKLNEETVVKEMQSLKAAWMREVQKEMKQMSIEEMNEGNEVAECSQKDNNSMDTDHFVEVHDNVLRQYFEMWKGMEQNVDEKEVECDSTRMRPAAPVLKLKLSLKQNPTNYQHP